MFETKEILESINNKNNMDLINIKSSLNEYRHNKLNLVNEIKNLFSCQDNDSVLYCEELNKLKNNNKNYQKDYIVMNNNNYTPIDLSTETITKLDINMDQFDDECLNN